MERRVGAYVEVVCIPIGEIFPHFLSAEGMREIYPMGTQTCFSRAKIRTSYHVFGCPCLPSLVTQPFNCTGVTGTGSNRKSPSWCHRFASKA